MATISTSEAVNYGLKSTRSSSDKYGVWKEASQSHHITFGESIPAGAQVGTATVTVHVRTQPIIGNYFYINGVGARTTVADHAVSLDTVTAGSNGLDLTITFKGTGTKNTVSTMNIDRIDFAVSYTPTQSGLTLSTSTMDAGDSLLATIVPAANTYSHKLTTTFGNRSQVQQVEAGVTTATVTVPVEWLDQIPNAGSGTGTITLTTMDGDAAIGTAEASLTVTVPDSAAPTITHAEEPVYTVKGVTYPDVSEGEYVQNTSAIKATATAITGKYGATITRQTITCQGTTTTGNTLTTELLQTSGSMAVVYTATDSRGLTATYTETVEVLAYHWPIIKTLTVERVDEDGEPSDTGTYAKGSVTYAWSKLGDKNTSVQVKISYSMDGGSSWTDVQTTTETGTAVSFTTGAFSTEQQIKFRAQVMDEYASVYAAETTDNLEMSWVARWFRHDRQGVAFGQASTKTDAFQIRGDWEYYQGEDKLLDLAAAQAPVTSVNGQTGDVSLTIPSAPTVTQKDYGGAYFSKDANASVTLSNFTVTESGLYAVQWNIQMVTALTGRSFAKFYGKRVSFANGASYPCVLITAIGWFDAGTTYPLTLYADTGGYMQYEDIASTVVKLN